MEYYAVGRYCAIDFNAGRTIDGFPSEEDCYEILMTLGFVPIMANITAMALSHIGHNNWKRSATIADAPEVFSCSVFTKYVFGKAGIWLPHLAIQQREFGFPVSLDEAYDGDLIFAEGYKPHYYNDKGDGVGHVGIVCQDRTVVHAGGPEKGVNQMPLRDFLAVSGAFRGVRRLIPKGEIFHTFSIPNNRAVEYSGDLRWLIMANLHLAT